MLNNIFKKVNGIFFGLVALSGIIISIPTTVMAVHIDLCSHLELKNDTEMLSQFKSAVFGVYLPKGREEIFAGTATVIQPDGYLLTAKHVVEAYDYVGSRVILKQKTGVRKEGKDEFYVFEALVKTRILSMKANN